MNGREERKQLVVVAEENEKLRGALERLFARKPWEVRWAYSAAEALELLATSVPDAVILGLCLPNGNGMDVLRAVRASRDSVPTIVVTRFGSQQSVRDAMELGVVEYFTFPFDPQELSATVHEALLQTSIGQAQGAVM